MRPRGFERFAGRAASMKLWRLLLVLLLVAVRRGGRRPRCWWLNRPLPLAADTGRAVDRARHDAARRSPRPGCRPACRRRRCLLYEWFRWSGQARKIRAGSYEIGRGTTPIALLDKMVRGDETLGRRAPDRRLDLPPDPRRAGASADALKPTTARMSDAELMAALGAPGVPPEGRFFPDTYAYSKGVSDLAVLKRALPRDAAAARRGLGRARAGHAAEDARRGADPGLDRREGNRRAGRPRPGRRRVRQPAARRHAAADRPDA